LSGTITAQSGGAHTVTITWGDGASTTLDLAAGVFNFTATHPYEQTGKFSIQVVVTDSGGGSDTANLAVYVARAVDRARVQRTGSTSNHKDPVQVGLAITNPVQSQGAHSDFSPDLTGTFVIRIDNLTQGVSLQSASLTINGVITQLTIGHDAAG